MEDLKTVQRKTHQSFDQILRLDEIQNMTAEELLKKHRMVIYSAYDIYKINRGLRMIQDVLDKNNNKIGEIL